MTIMMMKVMVTMMMIIMSRMMMMMRSLSEDPLPLVLWCVTCARTPLSCTTQTLLPTNRKSTPGRTSTARKCSSCWSNLEVVPSLAKRRESLFQILHTFSNSLEEQRASVRSCMCVCASGRTSLNISLRVVPHEPGLKLVCGHRPLILLGRVGVPHESPTTRPHREGCNSGTVFVQGLQRLQSSHSGKAHWRLTRLDNRLRSATARGTLTSGGQAEMRQCFFLTPEPRTRNKRQCT